MSIDDVIDFACNGRNALACLILLLACSKAAILHSNALLSLCFNIIVGWCSCVTLYALYSRTSASSSIKWDEEIAVVTGSSGGLGSAIVSVLLERGCRVACIDILRQETIQNIENDKIMYITADVTDTNQVDHLPEKIKAKFGRDATIVISNAGVMVGRRVLDFEKGQFERTISVNLLATYYLVKAFLPSMLLLDRGHIVATSSIIGYLGISQLTDYSASKHALIGFTESLRFELDKKYKAPKIYTTLLILGKLSTPLFARTTLSPISQFFTPIQDPCVVARALVEHLERGTSGSIYLPYLACLAPVLKAMPDFIRRAVQWMSGADEALQAENIEGSVK